MASIYDSIKTARELLEEVSMRGFSTKQEDICRAQDIFGHSSVDELVKLANDNGRSDRDGNPDPRGSWCSGREGLSKKFYMVLFQIWNWEDATRFYNQYSNFPVIDEKAELEAKKKELKKAEQQIKDLEAVEKCTENFYEQEKKKAEEVAGELESTKKSLAEAEDEIIRLKAKLYDLMTSSDKEDK